MGCHGSSRDNKQAALVIDPDLLPIPKNPFRNEEEFDSSWSL